MAPLHSVIKRAETFIVSKLSKLPVVAFYSKTRGWPFLIAWAHRITGIILVLYIWLHIYTLSLLKSPENFDTKMKILGFVLFVLLEWLLAVPVIFHALNGGRIILYESFGSRNDDGMIRWVSVLSIIYVLLLGLLMVMGNQAVSTVFFWILALIASFCILFLVSEKIRTTGNSIYWRLHRITGAFLLIMVPAHLLFMHLQPSIGHDSSVIIFRMQSVFVKIVDLLLVTCALYHGSYGMLSIAKDYIESKAFQTGVAVLVICIAVVFAWVGIKLTILI